MSIEKKQIKFRDNANQQHFEVVYLYDEALDDEEMVLLELTLLSKKISIKSENYFDALTALRRELEHNNIQILCNGAAKSVYPSPMQQAMGTGRIAYKLKNGQQAQTTDIVDIFDCDELLEFVTIDEQLEYYSEWLKSVMN